MGRSNLVKKRLEKKKRMVQEPSQKDILKEKEKE